MSLVGKARTMNTRMPGIEIVGLSSDGVFSDSHMKAERRPVTKSSPFAMVQINNDSLELVIHDDGTLECQPRDGMVIHASDGNYRIEQVVTQILGTRHHCLCTKHLGDRY